MNEMANDSSRARTDPAMAVDVLVVGAGFSGMYLVHRCRQLGLSVLVLEQGADVGGTWYWNRYPGARCDIPTVEYSYSFDKALEQEWDWQELMSTQGELLGYANHVADRFDLRSAMRFGICVTAADWDDPQGHWVVTSAAGETYTGRFLVLATGCLSVPNWPDIPGRERFAGTALHTGLWPHEPVDFSGRTVGMIGTGSSGVQATPDIAAAADHLYVFQRTPVYTFPAGNHSLDDAFRNDIKVDYDQLRQDQRQSLAGMVRYGVMGKLQQLSDEQLLELDPEAVFERIKREGPSLLRNFPDVHTDLAANEVSCDLYRRYVATVVDAPDTARGLMPRDYPIGCKRQVVDIGYYEAFNRPNITLVDLREEPMEEITARGVRTGQREVAVDVLVFATGFDAMTGAINRINIRGRDGRCLRDKWEAGPRTYLGLASAGFPNLFTVTGPGSPSVLSNMLVSIEQHVDWITDCVARLVADNCHSIEADQQSEDEWVSHVNEVAAGTMLTAHTCSSWYLGANIPGKPRVFMPYLGGVGAYREICDEVARDGYRGMTVRGGP